MKKRFGAWSLCLILMTALLFGGTAAVSAASPDASAKAILNGASLSPEKTGYTVLDQKVQTLLAQFQREGSTDTYSQVKACYDWLIKNVSYGSSGQSMPDLGKPFGYVSYAPYKVAANAWDPLYNGKGTCDNYSAAFILFTRAIGLESYLYSGETAKAGGGYVEHEWVEITVNGVNYVFDPNVEDNVADSTGSLQYMYFCKTEAEMQTRYIWESKAEIQDLRSEMGAENRLAKADAGYVVSGVNQFKALLQDQKQNMLGKKIYFSGVIGADDKLAIIQEIQSVFPGYRYRFVNEDYFEKIADAVKIEYPEYTYCKNTQIEAGGSTEVQVENIPEGVTIRASLSNTSVASLQPLNQTAGRTAFSIIGLQNGDTTLTVSGSDGYQKTFAIQVGISSDSLLDKERASLCRKVGTNDFTVRRAKDASAVKINVENPDLVSVALLDANSDQGLTYRITAKDQAGSSKITVSYQGKTGTIQAQVYNIGGSIMLDTANYIMAPNDIYDIGVFVKDGQGNSISGEKVQEMVRNGTLVVEDSRTGSIVDLTQLSNGNFRVTGKNEGACYIVYSINGTHASVRIDVKNGEKQHGTAVRNTSYWTDQYGTL